ncbi:MAG: hypothetical protein ABIK96_16990 [bacterium]|nr:hypothetical protein [bacterium]
MTPSERLDMYLDFLKAEGFRPEVVGEGIVGFKKEGLSFLIFVDQEDEQFFHLVCPNFWRLEGARERTRAYRAAGEATAQTKCVKVYPVAQNVCASVEMFCDPPEVFKAVFGRALEALTIGLDSFREEMEGK